MEPIINKIASSGLITIDLEDFYKRGKRLELDLAPWLYEGVILREKDFRAYVKDHNWIQYQDTFVNIICSEEAIIPQWAYMLLGAALAPFAQKVVYGSSEMLESLMLEESLNAMDFSEYKDQRIIVKGCSKLPIPPNTYLSFVSHLRPWAKSIMFGEACSTVPVYKRK